MANQTEVLAIQFSVDPTKALSAPAVELAFIKLKEGKTKADVATHIDTLVSQDTKTVISAVWGTAVGDETTFLMIVGWESLKVSFFSFFRLLHGGGTLGLGPDLR